MVVGQKKIWIKRILKYYRCWDSFLHKRQRQDSRCCFKDKERFFQGMFVFYRYLYATFTSHRHNFVSFYSRVDFFLLPASSFVITFFHRTKLFRAFWSLYRWHIHLCFCYCFKCECAYWNVLCVSCRSSIAADLGFAPKFNIHKVYHVDRVMNCTWIPKMDSDSVLFVLQHGINLL